MSWLWFALFTTIAWGVWGALIELPGKEGDFPSMLGYIVWACTMVPCALVALSQRRWRLELSGSAIWQGCLVGFLGAGGQVILFRAVEFVPPYIVFPIVSLYPVVTVLLAVAFLRERASNRQWLGVAIAIPAIVLLSIAPSEDKDKESEAATSVSQEVLPAVNPAAVAAIPALDELSEDASPTKSANNLEPIPEVTAQKIGWFALAMGVFVAWGVQAYFMKTATKFMTPEGLFFYMALTAILLVPLAYSWTTIPENFTLAPQWKWDSPWTVAAIQILNSLGALTLVYAMRTGKAMVVAPMTALAPVITIALSLAINSRWPSVGQSAGIVLASASIYLLAE